MNILIWYGLDLPAFSLTRNLLYISGCSISDSVSVVATGCVNLYLESAFGYVYLLSFGGVHSLWFGCLLQK